MRTNNSDGRWSALIVCAQAQNSAKRIYASAHNAADRATFFDPFVAWRLLRPSASDSGDLSEISLRRLAEVR